ncbi:MAG TPA: HAMP domain-containing sensor histidine kinase [Thermoanaerobaculia bacterium]|nr:HAMP domain-containing sensor histidine kinase [Thermoanaerobaculia bacterium]
MAAKCVMCGTSISEGIVCKKCDRPRKSERAAKPVSAAVEEPKPASPVASAPAPAAVPPAPQPPPMSQASAPGSSGGGHGAAHAATKPSPEPFPKAPVLPFPIESTSLAMTSICDVLTIAHVPSVLLGSDRSVKFCSADARILLGIDPAAPLPSLSDIEQRLKVKIEDVKKAQSATAEIGGKAGNFSLVPLSGGASGSVLILRPQDPNQAVHSSFISYVREAVLVPLRGLHESLVAASKGRKNDPILEDSASTIDQILSSLELAPGVEESPETSGGLAPSVTSVIRRVSDRFTSVAERKKVQLQLDIQETNESLRDHHDLEGVLVTLMENSLHYVPVGGQIVLGVRMLEHKGKPLILFFVMDNGPLVPEALKEAIFTPEFAWHPNEEKRGGRALSRVRDFATAHGGSVWVESKKACTFFLRVRPDASR